MRNTGTSSLGCFVRVALCVFIFLLGLIGGAYVFKYGVFKENFIKPAVAQQVSDDTSSDAHNICVDGYEYVYIRIVKGNQTYAGIAPRWDVKGRPATCRLKT